MKNSTTPKRSEIAKSDKWNIELLFKNEEEWEAALASIPEGGKEILKYKEAFSKPETIDAATLLACLKASTMPFYKNLQTRATPKTSNG